MAGGSVNIIMGHLHYIITLQQRSHGWMDERNTKQK